MTWLHWVLIGVGIYLALGVAWVVMLSQTPYSDNPAWIIILLWPLFLYGILFG